VKLDETRGTSPPFDGTGGNAVSETVKRRLRVIFPQHLAGQPILFKMAGEHDLVPTIRRAHLDGDGGEMLLELEGLREDLERGIDYLRSHGMVVAPAEEDVGS
jgi:hypothetical protein